MKGFDVLKVKSAVKTHSKFDLSRNHLTTMDFGQIVPLLVEETVPGDKFNISAEYFSRLAPLAVPTYGKFQFKTVSAFVPYHQIAWDIDAWMAGKTTWEGYTPNTRWMTIESLDNFIRYNCVTAGNSSGSDAEYTIVDNNGALKYYKFTNKGRYFVRILNALGYACPQGVDLQTTSYYWTTGKSQKLSALPILAFFKVYNDYMSQSQRFNTSTLSNALQAIKYGKSTTGFTPSTGFVGYQALQTMFNNLFLNYENDYFTSAWQSPNNSLGVGENINSVPIPASVPGNATVGQVNYDNIISQAGGTTITLGQRALDFLKDFDDWVRRNNYSGSRAVQQIYSRFGIKTDDYRSHYANILSTDSLPVQVGDVTSTSDTAGAILGDYAGKGIMSGSKGVSCSVSDYGVIIILGYFTVSPMNAYGFDRRVLRAEPLDYYNPEFDGMGADAISVGEYFSNPTGTQTSETVHNDSIFGFTERYNSYRYGRDVITGEFRSLNPNSTMTAWHTGRDLTTIRNAGNLVAQSSSVNTLPTNDSEYNRMFSITSGDEDHFYLTCRFKVDAIRPMLNLNQVVRLGEGDTNVPRNGNVIS